MRAIIVSLAVAAMGFSQAGELLAGDLIYGCMTRPACGKMCKLVCGTTKLAAVGYGCECKQICIPSPSRPGCKHCYTTCCGGNEIEGCRPKIEFCWYDWFACGCAKPRSIRTLTKYGAEKEVCFFHWEVVDGCACGCCAAKGGRKGCRCVFKPAPAESQVGDVIELTQDEQVELAAWMPEAESDLAAPLAEVEPAVANVPATLSQGDANATDWQRLAKLWGVSADSQ